MSYSVSLEEEVKRLKGTVCGKPVGFEDGSGCPKAAEGTGSVGTTAER